MYNRIRNFIKEKGVNELIHYLEYIITEATRYRKRIVLTLWVAVVIAAMLLIFPVIDIMVLTSGKNVAKEYILAGVFTLGMIVAFYAIHVKIKLSHISEILHISVLHRNRLVKIDKLYSSDDDKIRAAELAFKTYIRNISSVLSISRRKALEMVFNRDIDNLLKCA